MFGSLYIFLIGNFSTSCSTRSRNTLITGATEPGGLKSEGFESPECSMCEVISFWGLVGLELIYLCTLSFRTYLCMSIKVLHLFNFFGGANFKPLSRTRSSVSERLALLQLNIPLFFKFAFFFLVHGPPLVPRLVLYFDCTFRIPWENPLKRRVPVAVDYS